jgi:ABC-type phosphate transport system permease subunit
MPEATALAERLRIVEARASSDNFKDRLFHWILAAAGFFVLFSLLGAMYVMFSGGQAAFAKEGWKFITTDFWDPANNIFQGLSPIVGTLVSSIIALLFAVPISFGIALFLTEVAPPWIRNPIAIAIELLAGIPSIIYGMWGLFVLVPMLGEHVYPWINDNMGHWCRLTDRWHRACDHDHSIYCFGNARSLFDGAFPLERIGLCAWLNHMGSGLGRGSALHEISGDWRRIFGPWPRTW